MLNRRAHVGTLLLVFCSFFLMGAAIYSMLSFKGNFNDGSKDLQKLSYELAYNRAFIIGTARSLVFRAVVSASSLPDFKKEFESSLQALAEKKRTNFTTGDAIFKISFGNYRIVQNGDKYSLFVDDVSYVVRDGATEIKNTFSFGIVFDKTGVLYVR